MGSSLLDLYPRAWRERYGDEVAALLEDRPATLLDRLDLIRGALDAHLHPQVAGTVATPGPRIPTDRKLFGAVAAIGGGTWIAATATMFLLPRDAGGDRDPSLALIGFAAAIALIGTALGGLGTRPGSRSSAKTGVVIAAVSVVMAATAPWPWPLFIGALLLWPVLSVAAAVRGTTNGVLPTWIVLAFVAAAVGIMGGMSGSIQTDHGLALFVLPGVAGLSLAAAALTRPINSIEIIPA